MQIGTRVQRCVLLAAIAACANTNSPAVMDDSTFVAVMARLHVVDRKFELSDATRDSLRRDVLQEQGLTPQELEQQARHYAADPPRASAIWTAISRKAGRLAGDSVARETRLGDQQEQTR